MRRWTAASFICAGLCWNETTWWGFGNDFLKCNKENFDEAFLSDNVNFFFLRERCSTISVCGANCYRLVNGLKCPSWGRYFTTLKRRVASNSIFPEHLVSFWNVKLEDDVSFSELDIEIKWKVNKVETKGQQHIEVLDGTWSITNSFNSRVLNTFQVLIIYLKCAFYVCFLLFSSAFRKSLYSVFFSFGGGRRVGAQLASFLQSSHINYEWMQTPAGEYGL